MHDWYSRLGQGGGARVSVQLRHRDGQRHVVSPRRTRDLTNGDGSTSPAEQSFKVVGSAYQTLPHLFRARARVNYFSSVSTHQTFKTNIAGFLTKPPLLRRQCGWIVGALLDERYLPALGVVQQPDELWRDRQLTTLGPVTD